MLNEILWENLISKICPPTHLDLERIVKNFPFLYPFQSFWGLRNSERRETFERSLLRFESFEQSLRNVGKSRGDVPCFIHFLANVGNFYKNLILKFFLKNCSENVIYKEIQKVNVTKIQNKVWWDVQNHFLQLWFFHFLLTFDDQIFMCWLQILWLFQKSWCS